MQTPNSFLTSTGPLAAYGEYEEVTPSLKPIPEKPGAKSTPINRLVNEPSPYLRQYSGSPVGWYAWGEEALNAARDEDKPIFLSIGYSSDHWCHVMERDCFRDVEVAGMINGTCIPVMADREELPVLDAIMTEICRVQNGSAGYPLNVFMTSEGRPFMCVTWLPKRTLGQMLGITEIMPRIKWLWHMQRNDVERAADELLQKTSERLSILSGEKYHSTGRIGKFPAFEALNDMRSIFDIRWGGFGPSPKFPEYDKLLFLLGQAEEISGSSKRDKSDALTMTDITLRRMWRGGIHDHLGGGFCHYSVNEQWLVPHFEKLLCDNAMLLLIASKSQRLVQNSFHRLFAEDVIFSLTKDFAGDGSYSQGFVSAIDGDTPDGEGRYYLWNENEIKALLPEGDAGLFCAAYAVLPSGNFGSELAGSQMSWNILYEASTVTELARRYGMKGSEVASKLYEARKILLDYRDKRYPLKADTKVLMSWNGLVIGALAHASVSFEVPEWRDMAERTALFITKSFTDKTGKWFHVWQDGKSYIPATAEDYGYLLWGVIELYKAAKHFNAGEKQLSDWLTIACRLADILTEKFLDDKNGGFYLTEGSILGMRLKTAEDMNSLPSMNALAVMSLSELSFLTEEKRYSDIARHILGCFSRYARENPLKCLTLISADMEYKPFKPKKKPLPEPKPVPTDEELNREEIPEAPNEPSPDDKKSSRSSRRSTRQEATTTTRSDRASRRSARPHRTRER